MLNGRKILVTGSEGFIGSHLVERLVELGADVRAFVLYNSFGSWGWLEDLPAEVRAHVEVFGGDVRDADRVDQAAKGVDTVFHLAALIAIPYSYHAPESYVATNVTGTLNVLQAARRHGTPRVVVTSTSEVYGTAQSVPISEKHPLVGQSPYAATKIAADQLALSFHYAFGLPVAVLRPFNTFGPRQSARAVIPTVMVQALAGKTEVRVGSIHPTRDFTFVKDTVEGFVRIADCSAAVGQVVNLGTDTEITIGDLIVKIGEVVGRKLTAVSEDQRVRPPKSEVERLRADNTKARELFGWTPRYDLERGLAETATWLEQNLGRYKGEIYNL
ncbi:MAG TPA: NAD-dependent 4,6-dehydratase LegB [Polyangiaceae bacterium]|nr:NAD-dependent 4,6-dehydratase LegB [Polyangiaceae bacterium]